MTIRVEASPYQYSRRHQDTARNTAHLDSGRSRLHQYGMWFFGFVRTFDLIYKRICSSIVECDYSIVMVHCHKFILYSYMVKCDCLILYIHY